MTSALSLVSEPQLVREQQGRQQFLAWVLSVLKQCAELLPHSDAVLLHVWSLRLYALLCRLHCLGLSGVPASVVKQARTHAKQLLKQTQHRDNLLLYTEYALVSDLYPILSDSPIQMFRHFFVSYPHETLHSS